MKIALGCAYDFCRGMQPSEAMASRRGQIDRAHGWRGANVRMSLPQPVGAINLAPTVTLYKNRTHTYCIILDQPVGAFFPLVLLFVREADVAFFVLPLVVRVVVLFAFVDDFPFVAGVWGDSEVSSVVVTFLRVPLRADAPFCSGLSPAICC